MLFDAQQMSQLQSYVDSSRDNEARRRHSMAVTVLLEQRCWKQRCWKQRCWKQRCCGSSERDRPPVPPFPLGRSVVRCACPVQIWEPRPHLHYLPLIWQLLKWWAQFAESNGQFDKALQYYERANDHLAIVRVLCFHGKLDRAAEVVNESGDLGAAYHLAKQYEANGDIKQAIYFFQRSQRFNHAVRLAKQHDMAGDLTMLSQNAPPKLMVEAAEYFEARNMPDMHFTCPSRMPVTCPLHARHTPVTYPSHARHMPVTCPSHARYMHLNYHRRATCPTRPLRSTKRAGISRRRWTYASARARTTRCATSPSAWTPPPTRSYFTAARSSSLIT